VKRPNLADELVPLYPNVYKQYQLTQAQRQAQGYYNSFDGYGFETPDGWDDIMRRLSATLSNIVTADQLDINVVQVKEKFGGLRFYYERKTGDCTRFNSAIEAAERECYRTCCVCGKPGAVHNERGWLAVVCDEHKPKDTEDTKGTKC
jgi:hypothetical protein